MHARIDQLLSARDGELLDAAVAAHLNNCADCASELARLEQQRQSLRALPQLQAPDVWSALDRTGPATRFDSRWIAIAATAVFATVVTIGYSLRDEPAEIAQSEEPASELPQISAEQLATLIEQSRALETTLQQLPARRRVERAGTAATIDGLEQRIQWLDYYLSYASDGLDETQASRLWQERVQLMDTLVKVRYANTVATTM